jgi:hypothetical protein
MPKSSKVLTAAALVGIGAMLAGLTSAPLHGSARAVEAASATDIAADRIAAAFLAVPGEFAAVVEPARKGDLLVAAGCAGQKWPEIAPTCLVKADGSTARPVRSVLTSYQSGDATTVLVRMPAPQIASR